MTKQRPSFFVDDILHMVMPINTNTNNNLKRKRSINSKDDKRNEEEITNKKFRSYDANDKSNYSQVLDVIGDDGAGEEESCSSDNSNNIDDNSDSELYASSSCLPAITLRQNKKHRKPRTAFTDAQLNTLERNFERQKYISVQERLELANRLHLSDTQIKTWYQNRRTKWKRQACLGLELFAGNTIQQWIQRQPHLLAAAAAYRSSSDASNVIGPYGSALLSEAKAAIAAKSITHRFPPTAFTLHRQE